MDKTSRMKKYRLKRTYESPNCTIPAGTIGEWSASGKTLMFENAGCPIGWDVSIVKRNPDWFEEVKDERDVYLRAVSLIHGTGGSPKHQSIALGEEFVVIPRKDLELLKTDAVTTNPHIITVEYPKGMVSEWKFKTSSAHLTIRPA